MIHIPYSMKIELSTAERDLFSLIASASNEIGQPVFAIGGFVRDKILGKHVKDIDFVTEGDGPLLATRVAEKIGLQPASVAVFKTFGTAMLKYKDFELEFVGARKESYREDSRKPFVSVGTIRDDQLRRDFTINALAINLLDNSDGEIIDPFNGVEDLQHKRIVTPLDPKQTFSDDPLRMMRAIRFASQLRFSIDPVTFAAICSMKERIRIVSMERVTTELNKIILSKTPSEGFLLLDKSGLLDIILPDLVNLKGVEQQEGYGHKDNFYHTLQVLDNVAEVSSDLWLRWAAILHDIAKPQTKRFEPGHGWTFHGHEVLGAKMVGRIFRNLRLPMDEKMKFVELLVRLHLRPIALVQEQISDSAVRRLLFDAGDALEDLMILCKADITSKNMDRVSRYKERYEKVLEKLRDVEERDQIRNWQPPISGEVIMSTFGIKPGRIVGDIKTAIREAILDGELPNDYDKAFDFMVREAKKHNLTPLTD